MSAIRLLLLSAVVLLSTVTLTEGMRYGTGPRTCCFDFIDKSIKLNNVRSYKLTRQQCNKEAVLSIRCRQFLCGLRVLQKIIISVLPSLAHIVCVIFSYVYSCTLLFTCTV
uniref:Chemokine interleukin-8-like domain-containing protein n=1 Tax=Electrophorus electricus TaxID=8005 RepID=A0AAY5F421_ELEEL